MQRGRLPVLQRLRDGARGFPARAPAVPFHPLPKRHRLRFRSPPVHQPRLLHRRRAGAGACPDPAADGNAAPAAAQAAPGAAAAQSAAPAAAAGRRQGMPRPAAGGGFPPAAEAAAPQPAAVSAPASAARSQSPAGRAAPLKPAGEPAGTPPGAGSGRSRLVRAGIGAAVLLGLMAVVVLVARWLVTLESVQGFISEYPGESHLPDGAPVGLPGWLGWQHFFNAFFMVLIIRSGWQVRTQRKPPASWTPRWGKNPKKISITLWLHQSLDLLWLVNGALFVVLLLFTGQWMRVVPTSWDVFPNALSAALQYASLDWPTENGWVNYNSLQVLAYFTTIFIAAPLLPLADSGCPISGLRRPSG
ncbi:cytochrome b/b6 domain-containing protein [Arthrobacter sp. ATA002]|uniref:cytochrome b/b6 domain-containing protein n=1 Tax=Arthrobacter sp. ATA002 TaxID=2991715 RepID=UPI002E2F9E58|nr:hypothetical protein [Arthrobacter sp. ATA002]